MYMKLKMDILKLMSKRDERSQKTFTLRGIDGLDADDLTNLLSLCELYEREGDIGGWRDKITRTRVAEVLVKYGMW